VKQSGKHTKQAQSELAPDPAALPSVASASHETAEQLPREWLVRAPADDLDFRERAAWQATLSDAAFNRHRRYDEHLDRMAWHRMLRAFAGIVGIGIAAACLHRFLGLPTAATTELIAGGVIATGSGVMLRTLVAMLRQGGSERPRS
jgi:hypothetical protein